MSSNQNQQQHYSENTHQDEHMPVLSEQQAEHMEEVAPGVPIIRSNTPRPLSFAELHAANEQFEKGQHSEYEHPIQPLPAFPAKAPSAPPLPEELDYAEEDEFHEEDLRMDRESSLPAVHDEKISSHAQDILLPGKRSHSSPSGQASESEDFTWLFEYGLEMDPVILNSAERLNGQARFYGPALLKGYTLCFGAQHMYGGNGSTIIAIVPATEPEAEVWGVLYRVPLAVQQHDENEFSLLDTIHAAIPPQKFFKGVQVVVYETYRERKISCLSYVATDTAMQELHLEDPEHWHGDTLFLQRFLAIARQQKVPERFLQRFAALVVREEQGKPPASPMPTSFSRSAESFPGVAQAVSTQQHVLSSPEQPATSLDVDGEQNFSFDDLHTDALPIFKQKTAIEQSGSIPLYEPKTRQRALNVFAIYLLLLLLAILFFAVVQGMGLAGDILSANFAPIGVPGMVLLYGLLGGCISCLVTLGNLQVRQPPVFVLLTWFTRPFIGVVLAIFVYVLLTSGLLIFGQFGSRHITFFWLAGALAGLCENLLFRRRRS